MREMKVQLQYPLARTSRISQIIIRLTITFSKSRTVRIPHRGNLMSFKYQRVIPAASVHGEIKSGQLVM